MFWGNLPPIDSTDTAELPQLPGTIPQQIVTDDDLAGLTLAFDVADEPEVRHRGAHRRVRPATLAPRTAFGIGASFAAVAFVVWLWSGQTDAHPAVFRQAAPEAVTVIHTQKAKPKAPRPAEPLVRPVVPVATHVPAPVHTVTVSPSPSKSATPMPAPTPSVPTPRVTPTPVTPLPTVPATPSLPVTTTPAAPETAPTTGTEVPHDDA